MRQTCASQRCSLHARKRRRFRGDLSANWRSECEAWVMCGIVSKCSLEQSKDRQVARLMVWIFSQIEPSVRVNWDGHGYATPRLEMLLRIFRPIPRTDYLLSLLGLQLSIPWPLLLNTMFHLWQASVLFTFSPSLPIGHLHGHFLSFDHSIRFGTVPPIAASLLTTTRHLFVPHGRSGISRWIDPVRSGAFWAQAWTLYPKFDV